MTILVILTIFIKFFTQKAEGDYVSYNDMFLGTQFKDPETHYLSETITPVQFLMSLTPDYILLARIAKCESGWHSNALNKTSGAYGIFQFLPSTILSWGIGNMTDPYNQVEAAVNLYNARGSNPWWPSKSCWSSRSP